MMRVLTIFRDGKLQYINITEDSYKDIVCVAPHDGRYTIRATQFGTYRFECHALIGRKSLPLGTNRSLGDVIKAAIKKGYKVYNKDKEIKL